MYVWRHNSYACAAICFSYLAMWRSASCAMGAGKYQEVKRPDRGADEPPTFRSRDTPGIDH